MNVDHVILGAGITGLSLAAFLKERGRSVLVVETCSRAGGQMLTIHDEGFVFESGPNTGVVGNEAVLSLFKLLGNDCQLREADSSAAIRHILYKGKGTPLPTSLWSAITTPLFTWSDKLRFLGEPFRSRGTDPFESVASLVRRRLGQSYYNYAIDPFISGIYAGNPETLVTRFALPKLYRLDHEYGSFIRGAMKRAKPIKAERARGITRSIFSTDGGFSSLIDAIVAKVGSDNIVTGAEYSLQRSGDEGWKTTLTHPEHVAVKSRHVISTMPAHALPKALPFVLAAEIAPIAHLTYAPVIEIGVGLRDGSRIPRAFGLLVPSIEKEPVLGVLYNSVCYAGRAPEGGASLSVFVGGMRHPEMLDKTDTELAAIVTDILARYYGYPGGTQPDKLHIFRHRHAIPQYEADTPERLRAIGNIQMKYPGMILAGSICDGIGVADRIAQAMRIATLLCEDGKANESELISE